MFVSLQISGRLYDRVGPRPPVMIGLCGLAAATWMLSRLDVNTPNVYIQAALMLRGLSMGLTMMPSMTAWLAAAPVNQTASATALNNVLRQLFGAFGTAMYATILQQRIGFHYSTLSMFVTPDSPAVARLLAEAQQFALTHGLSYAQAKAMSIAQLAGQVRMAAQIQGFDDAFLLGSLACIIGLLPAYFLRKGPARPAGPAPAGPTPAAPAPAGAQPARAAVGD
jgi:hypothetical protein